MSSAGIDKTLDLDSRMKSAGDVIRPVDLDSCDSLEPKAKGKRKREVRFYYYLDTKLKLN